MKNLICPSCDTLIYSADDLHAGFCDCGYEFQDADILWLFIPKQKQSECLQLLERFNLI